MGFSKIDKVLCVAPLSAEWSAVSTKVSSVTAGQTLQKLDKAKTMFEGAKASAKVDVGTSKVKVGLAKKKVVFRIELAKGFYGKEDVTLVAKWTDQSALAKAYNDVKLHVDTSIMERLNSITTDVAEIMKMDDPVKAIAEFNRVQQRADKLTPICSQADIKKQASEAAKNRGASLVELMAAHGDELKRLMQFAKNELELRKKLIDKADVYVTNLEAQADINNRNAGNEDPEYTKNLKDLAAIYKKIVTDVRKEGPRAKVMIKRGEKLLEAIAATDDAAAVKDALEDFQQGKEAIEQNLEDVMAPGRSGPLGSRWQELGITPEDNSKWVMVHWWNATRENRKILMDLEAIEKKIAKAVKKFG